MVIVPELLKYSAATVSVVARGIVGTPSTFFNGPGSLFRDQGHDILGPSITLQSAPHWIRACVLPGAERIL